MKSTKNHLEWHWASEPWNAAFEANLRIEVKAEEVNEVGFKAKYSWWCKDTHCVDVGVKFLELPARDADIQTDSIFTDDRKHNLGGCRGNAEWNIPVYVEFKQPYKEIPEVVCWLTKIDTDKNANHRLAVFPKDVTTKGFVVSFYTWWDTRLYGAGAQWVAFSKNRSDICGVNMKETRNNDGKDDIEFNYGRNFPNLRNIFFALSKVDTGCRSNTRVQAFLEERTTEKAVVTVQTWGGSWMYKAGLSFIALSADSP